jgi:hypothetical protein
LLDAALSPSRPFDVILLDAAGNVSEQELEDTIKVAGKLQHSVSAWLRQNHPALSKTQS